MNRRMHARPYLAHTQHEYAEMLLARGDQADRSRVKELARSALATARELGMQSLQKRVLELREEG